MTEPRPAADQSTPEGAPITDDPKPDHPSSGGVEPFAGDDDIASGHLGDPDAR